MNAFKNPLKHDNMASQTPRIISKKPLFLQNNNLLNKNGKSDKNNYKNLNFMLFKQNLIRKKNKSENLNNKIDDDNLGILITNTNNLIKYKSPLQIVKSYSNISLSTDDNKKNFSNQKSKRFISNNAYIKDILTYSYKINENNPKKKIKIKNTHQFAFISNKQKKYFINNNKRSQDSQLKICKTMGSLPRPKTCKIKKFDERFMKFLEVSKKNFNIIKNEEMKNKGKEIFIYGNKDKLFSEKFIEEKYKVNKTLKDFDNQLLKNQYFTELFYNFKRKNNKLYNKILTNFKGFSS